ncbi:MAG: gamma-glutamyltransferase family protein [Thermomicrobiales bacterium]|nr:gamma-glutamyltransferase family protein [Thermomicrobiales bacterium]
MPRYPEAPTTTNVTVVDDAGNAIALTHSLGASSGVVSPGYGFTWNNIMNAANLQPGYRTRSRQEVAHHRHVPDDRPARRRAGTRRSARRAARGSSPAAVLLNVLDHARRRSRQFQRRASIARAICWIASRVSRPG